MGKAINSFNTTWNPYPGSSQSYMGAPGVATYYGGALGRCGCHPCVCGGCVGDPYGNGGLIVDRVLGSAYDTVRIVACNLPYIVEVARNMDAVRAAAANATRNIIGLVGVAGILGSTVVIPLPGGLAAEDVVDYTGVVEGLTDIIYNQGSGFFSLVLNSSLAQFELTLDAGAPTDMANGDVRINVTYIA